ncbi:PIG-L family deacetylase [Luteimicrobium sp. NPDC057192]|uniref:PIG-L family deacetylase n=1 Tax=Luteimicrobium sp. NPDC057192 TaxID=3346042 RepID=UPI00363F3D66
MEPRGGLVVVHAHPDDETLATGALLATWAAAGESVTVVTCTRGERGEVIDTVAHPTGVGSLEGDGPALAAYRERELAGALASLGVTDHVFLDTVPLPDDVAPVRYEDSGMAWVAPGIASHAAEGAPGGAFVGVSLDEAARRLVAVLRERRPAVVATYDPQGGYGHPDHVRTHEVTVRALQLLGDEQGKGAGDEPGPSGAAQGTPVPALWCVVQPAADVRAARRALAASAEVADLLRARPAGTGLSLPDPDEPVLPPVSTWWPADAPTLAERLPGLEAGPGLVVVPVGPVLDRVAGALRAHATQVQAVAVTPAAEGEALVGRYALSNDVLAPLLTAERYATFSPRPVPGGVVGRPGTPGTVAP